MKNKNICKFISPAPSDALSVSCFVLESDPAVMHEATRLKEHRVLLVIQGGEEYSALTKASFPFPVAVLCLDSKAKSSRRSAKGTANICI